MKPRQTNTEKKTIRLSHPRMGTIQTNPDTILMAMSDGHKVKVLVVSGKEHNWFERSGSLNKFTGILEKGKFERVNKFYILNMSRVLSYNNKTQTIFFKTDFSVLLKHKIKPAVFKSGSL